MWSDRGNNLLSAVVFQDEGLFFLHLVVVTPCPRTSREVHDLDIADPKIAARYDAIIKYWTKR